MDEFTDFLEELFTRSSSFLPYGFLDTKTRQLNYDEIRTDIGIGAIHAMGCACCANAVD